MSSFVTRGLAWPIGFMGFVISMAACNTEVEDLDPAGEGAQLGRAQQAFVTATQALPQGLACGLQHYTVRDSNGCDGAPKGKVAPGFREVADGDLGAPANKGFRHQSLMANTQASASYASDSLPLPRGTACGFKHTRNSPNERCMGFDAAVACPPGWARRSFTDNGSDVLRQGDWAWCEYEDPNVVCASTNSCAENVPVGTVCGLSYEPGIVVGICDGFTGACPPGWTHRGPNDEGAPAGFGLAWCEKNAACKKTSILDNCRSH